VNPGVATVVSITEPWLVQLAFAGAAAHLLMKRSNRLALSAFGALFLSIALLWALRRISFDFDRAWDDGIVDPIFRAKLLRGRGEDLAFFTMFVLAPLGLAFATARLARRRPSEKECPPAGKA
jgi:hypothetical protein